MKHTLTVFLAAMAAFATTAAEFEFKASDRTDPARVKGLLCSGYKASSDASVPVRYEFVGLNENTALRIVSHGDNNVEKNSDFAHFRVYYPVTLNADVMEISFSFKYVDCAPGKAFFLVSGFLNDIPGEKKLRGLSLRFYPDRVTMNKRVVNRDFTKGTQTFTLTLNKKNNQATLSSNGKTIATDELADGPAEAPQFRFGDGSSMVNGSVDLYFIRCSTR